MPVHQETVSALPFSSLFPVFRKVMHYLPHCTSMESHRYRHRPLPRANTPRSLNFFNLISTDQHILKAGRMHAAKPLNPISQTVYLHSWVIYWKPIICLMTCLLVESALLTLCSYQCRSFFNGLNKFWILRRISLTWDHNHVLKPLKISKYPHKRIDN